MNTNHFDISTPAALDAMAKQEKIELTPGQAKMLTKAIKENLNALPSQIMICLKGKAYKAMGYSSVSEWALAEFGLSRSRIYQLNAVASAEHTLRKQFKLSASFVLAEGQFRPLAGNIEAVLETIATALALSEIADTESARESVVHDSISTMVMALERKERKERSRKAADRMKAAPIPAVPVAAAISEITPKAARETASANNVVAFTPRSESPKHIDSVALSYELALVKAQDTGHVLMALTADTDAGLVVDALMDAQSVITELLSFVSVAAAA